MLHLRHPIVYTCADDADDATRKSARLGLVRSLKTALKAVLGITTASADPDPLSFVPRASEDGIARFRNPVEPLGALHDPLIQLRGDAPVMVHLKPGPAMWLRVMPQHALSDSLFSTDIERALKQGGAVPCPLNWHDAPQLQSLRGPDGFGICAGTTGNTTSAVIFCFATGEVWTIDTAYLASEPQNQVHLSEESFARALMGCAGILRRLGITGPFRWLAGLEGVKNRQLTPVGHAFTVPPPPFLVDMVTREGVFAGSPADPKAALEPFFQAAFDLAHVRRAKA
jgi:hypothetical protein